MKIQAGHIPAPTWYMNLTTFINKIQNRFNQLDMDPIAGPTIIAVKKENKIDCRKFRPISQYSLADRIIIGQTAKYLTILLDDQLMDCSYAFRASVPGLGVKTHHDAIQDIIQFKKKYRDNEIYVAECDIKKFFDCVSHDQIIKIFATFIKKASEDKIYDERASLFFYQYLASYAFNLDVYTLNNGPYFTRLGLDSGEFEWPESQLRNEFYGDSILRKRIGVPQGGALSCLIANLLLHNVDEAVLCSRTSDPITYFRFCDDMILMSTSEDSCEEALNRYMNTIKTNFLLVHTPKSIPYGKKFFDDKISKSKAPYQWGNIAKAKTSVPWVSFVGYQIKHDLSVRVRKKSLKKEIEKQKKESLTVLKAIRSHDSENINIHSRKSRKQQLIALESRLIAMSVGRKKMHNYKKPSGMCWTNGFKKLSNHAVTRSQMRLLDCNRSRQLYSVKKKLASLNKPSHDPDDKKLDSRFLGPPFSYFGFLHQDNI